MRMQNAKTVQLEKPLIIVPAAGFGNRVGSPLSKEMLKRSDDTFLIDLALTQAQKLSWPMHVVTRKEKVNLTEYLNSKDNVSVQLIEASQEWPDSVLKSKDYWHEWNLLFLPDTEYSPADIIDQLWLEMRSRKIEFAAATFPTDEPKLWGCIRQVGDGYEFCEKPNDKRRGAEAWGFLFFKKEFGEKLFSSLLESCFDHQWKFFKTKSVTLQMDEFKDITR